MSTGSETPFHLAVDDDGDGDDENPARGGAAGHYNNRRHHNEDDTDTFSATSRYSFASTTDGIDVLGGGGGRDATVGVSSFLVWVRLRAGRVVSSVPFKRSALGLILLCSILLALRTAAESVEDRLVRVVDGMLSVLLWIFTAEVTTQAAFYQDQIPFTGWLVADIIIIVTAWFARDKSCLVLRAFRLLRALRKASGVPSLKWAVKAVLRALPRIMAVIAVLLPGVFAIFAILFTNLYSGADGLSQDYFGRLDVAAMTLFQIMTGGRNWARISLELQEQYPWSWIPLVLFIAVSLFVFGSLIVAVMCDAVSSVGREQLSRSLDHRVAASGSKEDQLIYASEQQQQSVVPDSTELRRVEQKLDELSSAVDKLVRMQASMQESMTLLAQQQVAAEQTNSNDEP